MHTLAEAQRRIDHRIRIYAPGPVLNSVRERFGHLWSDKTYRRIWQPHVIEQEANLWSMQVRPLRINHGIGGTAYGYLLAYNGTRAAYVSDMLRAGPDIQESLQGLDLLVLGASHYYEGIDEWKRSIMDVVGTLELIRSVKPNRAVLTHLSHTIDYDRVATGLPANVQLAYDGLTVEV
jgi:phosphoribosyl 1,2-cyclic phosphate phosphodiesterase